jgi:hypothetical protein
MGTFTTGNGRLYTSIITIENTYAFALAVTDFHLRILFLCTYRVYPGGIVVEAPALVEAGVAAKVRVSWMPCGGLDEKRGSMLSAEITFDAMVLDEAAVAAGTLKLQLPTVYNLFVDKLEPA